MKFQKIIYRLHTHRQDERIFCCKASQTPLQNSSFNGSFIAGMAQLRYTYSMPVERIVKYFNYNGFYINKAMVNGLLSKTADMFENLHKALGQAVSKDKYINCDETYHKVITKTQNPDTPNINKEYIWAMSAMNLNLAWNHPGYNLLGKIRLPWKGVRWQAIRALLWMDGVSLLVFINDRLVEGRKTGRAFRVTLPIAF